MKRRNGEGSVYRRDRGGEAALVVQGRGAGNLRNAGLDVQVVTLPNGTDPAEHLAHRDNTLEVFRPDQAVPLLTAQVHRAVAAQGDHIQWVAGRRTAARTIVRYLATYPASYTPQIGWIANALHLDASTFTGEVVEAYRRKGEHSRDAANGGRQLMR
jgi:hypothetical protein